MDCPRVPDSCGDRLASARRILSRECTFFGQEVLCPKRTPQGGGGYNNILTVGADPDGMYVSVFVLFRFGHPPLFIPWEDVSAEAKRVWLFNVVILKFARCPSIPFWISRKLADKLEMASGVQFIEQEIT